MKLYTEEEIRETISNTLRIINSEKTWTYDDVINLLRPIELPSDEEIEKESNKEYQEQEQSYENSTEFFPFNDSLYLKEGFFQGAKWMKEQILNK